MYLINDSTIMLERNKYVINERQNGFSLIDIILFFTIEFLIAITFYYLIRILNYINSLLPKPPRDLTGDVVLIIGATSILGTSLAKEFAKKGCSIICIDKDNNIVQQLVLDLQSCYTGFKDNLKGTQRTEEESLTNPRIIAYQCDMSNPDEIKNLVNKFRNEIGGIDILITCIDITRRNSFDIANTIWLTHYSTISTFLSLMLNRRRVYIIGVTSISSRNASINSEVSIANIMERLGEKLNDHLDNYTLFAISSVIKIRSIKQSEQQVVRDIVEAVRRDSSNLIHDWGSRLLYRARLDKVLQFLLSHFNSIYY